MGRNSIGRLQYFKLFYYSIIYNNVYFYQKFLFTLHVNKFVISIMSVVQKCYN